MRYEPILFSNKTFYKIIKLKKDIQQLSVLFPYPYYKLSQCLFDIGNDIINILYTYRKTD